MTEKNWSTELETPDAVQDIVQELAQDVVQDVLHDLAPAASVEAALASGPDSAAPISPAAPSSVTYADTICVRDACLCLHVQRAARQLARHFDEAFRRFGLTNGQFSLMMALNQPHPPSIGAVATILASDRTTLTAALKPLERRGLVLQIPDVKDRRSRRLHLTPEGLALLGSALPVWRSEHAALERALAERDTPVAALRRGLDHIGASLDG